jgi:SNF2 family DNA or RNA helicase
MRSLALSDGKLKLYCHYMDRMAAREIPGCRWDPDHKCWVYPLSSYPDIRRVFPVIKVPEEVLEAVQPVAKQEISLVSARKEDWSNATPLEPIPLKTKPYRHQVHAFNCGITHKSYAFFLDMGSGKTLSAIAIAGRRHLRGEVSKLLIICPASVMDVWREEFAKHADFPYKLQVLSGAISKRAEMLSRWTNAKGLNVAVINYEGARGMPDALAAWGADMLIADEAHRLKTPGTQQSKKIARIAKEITYKLALTGTPITNSPLDVYGIYRILDSNIFGPSFYSFRNRYAIMGGYGNHQIVGYRRMDELMERIHRIAFRLRKDECLDLPEMTDVRRSTELDAKAKKLYRQMAEDSIAELAQGETVIAANVLTRLLRLSQIAGGFLDGEAIHRAKLNLLADVLDELDGQKAVIFVRFTDEKMAIEKLLESLQISYVSLDGSTPLKARGELVERFQTDPDTRVFVGQIQAAGTGITLHAASTAIFYSVSYSYADLDQARSRIHRSGQKYPVTNIFLTARGTVDEKVLKVLSEKRNLAETIVDNWRNLFTLEGSD